MSNTETLDWTVVDLDTRRELYIGCGKGAWKALAEFRDAGRKVGILVVADCGCIVRGWENPQIADANVDVCDTHRGDS